MSDLGTWFKNIPIITRCWFGGTIALTLLGKFGLLHPSHLILLWDPLVYRLQLWRPFSAALFYPLSPQNGFHFLLNLYFLYNYSLRLETATFINRTADYFYMQLFIWFCTVSVSLCLNILVSTMCLLKLVLIYHSFTPSEIYCSVMPQVFMDILVLATLYVWCQLNKDVVVQFWFGTQFQAMYLPWVLLAFNMIISGSGFFEFLGIIVGHLYYFLAFSYPQDFGGPSLLETPEFIRGFFPGDTRPRGFGSVPQRPQQEAGTRSWGRGNVLGRD
ncbi:unnamed protein product [Cyprideis torosa]|uniref:Derlin n=1 Tax=Cyprideis torosa TaxID=163714 RepID=A0A7R8ZL99_9CRUS|nr:unnamed protein product [Cyprideis torosa]CAG0883169.1 unnamed protein product [Cyprideis torosa]